MNTIPMFIIESDCIVDGIGDLSRTNRIYEVLLKTKSRVKEFTVASIKDGWHTPLPSNRLRCACSPMTAILEGQKLFSQQKIDAIVIYGKDHIKSEFRFKKVERNQLMHMYGENGHILQAYNVLAHEFLRYWKISPEEFRSLSGELFENHLRVWRQKNPNAERPAKKWFEPVTDLFRGVDCANPSVDFEGCLIIGTHAMARRCDVTLDNCVQIVGCQLEKVGEDSMEWIPEIVPYEHLRVAFEKTCEQAHVNFASEFLSRRALLEVYSCYPVVPLGFLLATGLVRSTGEIPEFLNKYPITITGGLNLSKAAWNNSTLNALVTMVEQLRAKDSPVIGAIHSIGALGYMQAFTILKKITT
ncbi:hypothetical protein ACFL9U_06395 [Thermodesulfobacteriota bacterium]